MSSPTPSVARSGRTPGGFPHVLTQALLALTLVLGVVSVVAGQITDFGAVWTILLLALSLAVSIWVTPRSFVVGFLVSLLPFLVVWRIAAMAGGQTVDGEWLIVGDRPWPLMVACGVTLIAFVAEYALAWRHDLRARTKDVWLLNLAWGATLVRIFFGFNELGHATEKIFAGHASWSFMTDVVFGPLGQSASGPFGLLGNVPGFFVVLAGIIEITFGFLVGAGLLTRFGGALGVGYLVLATLAYGGEWTNCYGWAGAGWEYPALMIVFFGSFILTGAGPFSIDHRLATSGRLPAWARRLALPRSAAGTEELSPVVE